jgi:ATP-dependent DNA ligase
MLARLERALPRTERLLFEPKLDGFRCLAFRDGGEVELQSRHGNPLARYFPELVERLFEVDEQRFVVDGEIVVDAPFEALMARLHPAASRVELLRRQTPARLVSFDLLALGDADLRARPFGERRNLLERLGLELTPITSDRDVAAAWLAEHEGVVAKDPLAPYAAGKRTMVKVKPERTADCVVAGFRWRVDRPLPSSLLLGLHDDDGTLQHVGVASSFGVRQAEAILDRVRPRRVALDGHPWAQGFLLRGGPAGRLRGAAGRWTPEMTMDWVPLEPTLVAEVSYDQVDGDRFRHPARFRRWRDDRDATSCTFDQFGGAVELVS